MDKAAHRRAPWWLAFFCVIEASFFPIPPHPLLGLMCLAEPRRALRFGIIATLASVAGGMFGYAIGWGLYGSVGEWLIAILGYTETFPEAQCRFAELGPWAVFIGGATPIPFKLMTLTAGFMEMAIIPFILASLAGRGLVFVVVGALFRVFGTPIKAFIERYLGLVTTVFALLVVAGFLAISQLSGRDESEGGSGTCAATVPLGMEVR
ncbi:MAG: DedA family protein [Alphaproteobacteria bacterium]|jgi:membrane protein YqaA with SNARE-associated domain|nr:DedA family protein [Alphaproteobacteria bacterium]